MMLDLRFTVRGQAVGAARPRVTRGGAHTFMPAKSVRWEQAVGMAAIEAHSGGLPYTPPMVDAPCRLIVDVLAARPQRMLRKSSPTRRAWATCKPDLDNVMKLVMDGLVKAGIIVDDTRIVELLATRRYVAAEGGSPTEPPSVTVIVQQIANP
jgi:Holliday junction resolvase RusA-like endonuclease